MFEKLGKRALIIPLVLTIVIGRIFTFSFYPLANMNVEGATMAVLSLDEGVSTAQGTINVGDELVEALTSSEAEASGSESESESGSESIVWEGVSSQEELDAALEAGDYYGAVIVPEDYSAQALAAKQADAESVSSLLQTSGDESAATTAFTSGSASGLSLLGSSTGATVSLVVDLEKGSLVADWVETAVAEELGELGIESETTTIHDASVVTDDASLANNPMAGTLGLQLTIAPITTMAVLGAALITSIFKLKRSDSPSDKWKTIGKQVAYAAVVALLEALVVGILLPWDTGLQVALMDFLPFMWLTGFCLIVFFAGVMDVSLLAGLLVAVATLAFGMMTGILPYEALPSTWQNLVYPWAPQRFIGEGLRSLLYLGESALSVKSVGLVAYALVGLVAASVATQLKEKKAKQHDESKAGKGRLGAKLRERRRRDKGARNDGRIATGGIGEGQLGSAAVSAQQEG